MTRPHSPLLVVLALGCAGCVSNPTPHPGSEDGDGGGGSFVGGTGSGSGGSATGGDSGAGSSAGTADPGVDDGTSAGDGTDRASGGGGTGDGGAGEADGGTWVGEDAANGPAPEADVPGAWDADEGWGWDVEDAGPSDDGDTVEGGEDAADGESSGEDAWPADDATTDAGGADDDSADSTTGTPTGPLFTLSDPQQSDGGGDGVWSPGETLNVTVTLTNDSGEDYMAYPSVRLESNQDWAVIGSPDFNFFGLFAGQSNDAFFSVAAADDAPVGGEVVLTATVFGLNCETSGLGDCPYAEPLEILAVISEQ